MRNEFEKAHMS